MSNDGKYINNIFLVALASRKRHQRQSEIHRKILLQLIFVHEQFI